MNAVDAIGTIAEILSWIGLGLGLPLLAVVLLVKAHDGSWLPQEVVIVEDESGRARARWFAAGDFRERPLRAAESPHWHGREDVDAFVSERHPTLMRFEPPQAPSPCVPGARDHAGRRRRGRGRLIDRAPLRRLTARCPRNAIPGRMETCLILRSPLAPGSTPMRRASPPRSRIRRRRCRRCSRRA